MICEICGINRASKKVFLEGTTVNICEKCFKSLKIRSDISKNNKKIIEKRPIEISIEEDFIEDNFNEKIKKYRETNKLKQKDMAKLLGIKESFYKNLEEGKIKPSLELAKKIEKIIGEKIIKKEKIEKEKREEKFSIKVSDILEFEE